MYMVTQLETQNGTEYSVDDVTNGINNVKRFRCKNHAEMCCFDLNRAEIEKRDFNDFIDSLWV